MIAVRMIKRIEGPIPGLPEFDPLIGKEVELIAMEVPREEHADAEAPQYIPPPPPSLEEAPPLRQRVRVCGMVSGVSDGGDTFRLLLDDEHAVPCAWAGEGSSPVIGMAGRKVVVAGTGVFDLQGALIRVDTKAAAAALQADLRFAKFPMFGETLSDDAEMMPTYADPIPQVGTVAPADVPSETPRPAFSALTSFKELFGQNGPEETE